MTWKWWFFSCISGKMNDKNMDLCYTKELIKSHIWSFRLTKKYMLIMVGQIICMSCGIEES
jgi:hypothetical protein